MSVYAVCFSPTGGTKKVIEGLTFAWEGVIPMDLSDSCENFLKYSFAEDDVCLIGFPVFEGRVPPIVLERLAAMKGHGTPAILVAVYGNRDINDALLELKNEMMARGFYPFAAVSAVAQHSSLPQFAVGRPDENDIVELQNFSLRIKEKLESGDCSEPVEVPGKEPYIILGGKAPKNYPLFDPENCTHCMKCAQKCPAKAISMEDLSLLNQETCARCMRCVAICPVHARFLDPERQAATATRLAKAFEGRKPNQIYL